MDGKIEGPIQGGDVVLKSQAHVVGDIHHQSLAIERGAYFDGRSIQVRGANGHQPERLGQRLQRVAKDSQETLTSTGRVQSLGYPRKSSVLTPHSLPLARPGMSKRQTCKGTSATHTPLRRNQMIGSNPGPGGSFGRSAIHANPWSSGECRPITLPPPTHGCHLSC